MNEVQALKQKLREQGLKGLALDIDETLSDTGPHWWGHMMKFHIPEGLTYEKLLEQYQFIEHVPAWQTEHAKAYISETLESNEFNEAIPLLHESNSVIKKLNTLVPIVAYITARPEAVRQGTERWLIKHEFPRAEVILRPGRPGFHGLEKKNAWKAGVLKELYPYVSGIVDDNPGLLDALMEIGYEGTVFLYGGSYDKKHFHPPTDRTWPFPVVISPSWSHVLDYFVK